MAPPAQNGSAAAGPDHGCSARSERLLKPALSYIDTHVKAIKEGLWDPKKRKDGWIPLDVAENKLGTKLVLEKLESVRGFPEHVLNYGGMKGIPECQAAFARLLERHLVPGHSVDPNHLAIASGCGALLDSLFWCICDAGDGVLIPAPYYPAFDNDLQVKCGVVPLPFHLKEGEAEAKGAGIRGQLDAAVVSAAARGIAVRGLLITNPTNPEGTIYREDTIREMLKWCLDNRMHYISDEVYALSVFKSEAKFTSAVTIARQLLPPPGKDAGKRQRRGRLGSLFARRPSTPGSDASSSSDDTDSDDNEEVKASKRAAREARKALREAKKKAKAEAAKKKAEEEAAARAASTSNSALGNYSQQQVDTYVHLLYGLSKDWCGSGLRVGVLYSRNERLHKALDPISIFSGVSGHTQWAVAQMLEDVEWTADFLQKNRALLEKSYDTLAAVLKEEKIPFVEAVAGMFVWIDLRKWLPEPHTWEGERKFWQRVCEDCKIVLTPGQDCHAAEPGHFRLCFAWMPPEALKEAVQRLRNRVLEEEEGGDCAIQ